LSVPWIARPSGQPTAAPRLSRHSASNTSLWRI